MKLFRERGHYCMALHITYDAYVFMESHKQRLELVGKKRSKL